MVQLQYNGSIGTPEMFEFSLSSVKDAAYIDIAEFTVIGSTLVKSSNLIKHGKRLENMSWRIMGKNLVSPKSFVSHEPAEIQPKDLYNDAQARVKPNRGLVPQNVFKNSINQSFEDVLNKNLAVRQPSGCAKKMRPERTLKQTDFNSIVSIVTKPSLAQTLSSKAMKRNSSSGSGNLHRNGVSNNPSNSSTLLQSYTSNTSLNNSTTSANGKPKSQRPGLTKRNSSKGKLTFSYKNNTVTLTNSNSTTLLLKKNANLKGLSTGNLKGLNKPEQTVKQHSEPTLYNPESQLKFHGNVNNVKLHDYNSQSKFQDYNSQSKFHDYNSQPKFRDYNPQPKFHDYNPQPKFHDVIGNVKLQDYNSLELSGKQSYKPVVEGPKSKNTYGRESTKESSLHSSKEPLVLSNKSIKAVDTRSQINIEEQLSHGSHSHKKKKDRKMMADFFIKPESESDLSLVSKKKGTPKDKNTNIASLFHSKSRNKSSSGSIMSEDDQDDEDSLDSDSDSDFDIYSDDEHPITKFKSKDSFTEKLRELKSEVGLPDEVIRHNSKGLFNKNAASKQTKKLTKTKSNVSSIINEDTQSVDSTKKLLKRQSSLFPTQRNHAPIMFSDDSFSDEEDDHDDDDHDDDDDFSSSDDDFSDDKNTDSGENPDRRKSSQTMSDDDNDAWTDDDDQSSNVSNFHISKHNDVSRPAIKKSLLSGLFLNELNKADNSRMGRRLQKDNSNSGSNSSNKSVGSNGLDQLTRQISNASNISKSSSNESHTNGHRTSTNLSKVIYSNSGGLQLRLDLVGEKKSSQETKQTPQNETATPPPTLYRNNSELLLKTKTSNSSLNTYASLQPVMATNVTGTTTKPQSDQPKKNGSIKSDHSGSDESNIDRETTQDNGGNFNNLVRSHSTNTIADLCESLRRNSRSLSTSSFTNLLQMPFQYFTRTSSIDPSRGRPSSLKPGNSNDDSSAANNRLKLDLLLKRSSNAPPTAKSLLNTAYTSHMFHQNMPGMKNPNRDGPRNNVKQDPAIPVKPNQNEKPAKTQESSSTNTNPDYQTNLTVKESDIRSIVFGNFDNKNGDKQIPVSATFINQSKATNYDQQEEMDPFEVDSYHNRGW